jgi:predicted transcriptional regulator
MAGRKPPPLSEAQLEILHVIWDHGEAAVGDVWEILAKRRPVARNTISTMVTRLEEKGWLRHRVRRGSYLYSATRPREKVLPRLVRRLTDSAFKGSAEGLVLALLESRRLSAAELERIRQMLEKAESELREAQQ